MSSANDRTLVVVSHYMARPKDDLQALLAQLQVVTSDVLVVINDDAHHGPAEWVKNMPVSCVKRENTGMNIGGWNEGYKQKPDFDHYIFLQDECRIVDNDFLTVYQDRLREPGIGMIGESLNPKWDRSWPELSASPLNYPVHITPGSPAMLRMSFYQACLKNWNIDPGPTGSHLRALIWGCSASTLNAMNGFRVGRNKEECIAAEIAASKAAQQNAGQIVQSSTTSFTFIQHKEWRSDGMSKLSS
jgi:hypothetical protein